MVYAIKCFRKVSQKSSKLIPSINSFLALSNYNQEAMLSIVIFPKATLTWNKYIFKLIIKLAVKNLFIYFTEVGKYIYKGL